MAKIRKAFIKEIHGLTNNNRTGRVAQLYKRYRVIQTTDGERVGTSKLITSRKKAEAYLEAEKRRFKRMELRERGN